MQKPTHAFELDTRNLLGFDQMARKSAAPASLEAGAQKLAASVGAKVGIKPLAPKLGAKVGIKPL